MASWLRARCVLRASFAATAARLVPRTLSSSAWRATRFAGIGAVDTAAVIPANDGGCYLRIMVSAGANRGHRDADFRRARRDAVGRVTGDLHSLTPPPAPEVDFRAGE